MAIKGARILTQEAIMETPNWVFTTVAIVVVCEIILEILFLLIRTEWLEDAFIVTGCIFAAYFIIALCGFFDKSSSRNTYKCIFNEDVSIQEVYEKYDVVGRDGEIWILEDKE